MTIKVIFLSTTIVHAKTLKQECDFNLGDITGKIFRNGEKVKVIRESSNTKLISVFDGMTCYDWKELTSHKIDSPQKANFKCVKNSQKNLSKEELEKSLQDPFTILFGNPCYFGTVENWLGKNNFGKVVVNIKCKDVTSTDLEIPKIKFTETCEVAPSRTDHLAH